VKYEIMIQSSLEAELTKLKICKSSNLALHILSGGDNSHFPQYYIHKVTRRAFKTPPALIKVVNRNT
jgi:hypothetical protein